MHTTLTNPHKVTEKLSLLKSLSWVERIVSFAFLFLLFRNLKNMKGQQGGALRDTTKSKSYKVVRSEVRFKDVVGMQKAKD